MISIVEDWKNDLGMKRSPEAMTALWWPVGHFPPPGARRHILAILGYVTTSYDSPISDVAYRG